MKALFASFALLLLMCGSLSAQQDMTGFPRLTGPYLGQKPPGTTPEPFASGIFLSRYSRYHTIIHFSPNGKEAYWQAVKKVNRPEDQGGGGIFTSHLEGDRWTPPAPAPFSILNNNDDTPFLSPDGNRLFFITTRPPEKEEKSDGEKIWCLEQTPTGWSRQKPLPPIINSMRLIHWGISVDRENTLYFGVRPSMSLLDGYAGDIYCSRMINGQYGTPEKLPPSVNMPGYKFSPFIAPDGSYLLFTQIGSQDDHYKICISFRRKDGSWTMAKEINDIIHMTERKNPITCPFVTPDGKYLFFLNIVNNISSPYWVDAGFIEELKRTELNWNKTEN